MKREDDHADEFIDDHNNKNNPRRMGTAGARRCRS
jgi:hypothetical protein